MITPPGAAVPEGRIARMGEALFDYGLPSISTSVRYGAPGIGVGLAVKGISNVMNPQEQTQQAVMP